MRLNTMKPADGSKRNRRRVGRGIGSGLGKTSGKGHKGAKARSGGTVPTMRSGWMVCISRWNLGSRVAALLPG